MQWNGILGISFAQTRTRNYTFARWHKRMPRLLHHHQFILDIRLENNFCQTISLMHRMCRCTTNNLVWNAICVQLFIGVFRFLCEDFIPSGFQAFPNYNVRYNAIVVHTAFIRTRVANSKLIIKPTIPRIAIAILSIVLFAAPIGTQHKFRPSKRPSSQCYKTVFVCSPKMFVGIQRTKKMRNRKQKILHFASYSACLEWWRMSLMRANTSDTRDTQHKSSFIYFLAHCLVRAVFLSA